MSEPAAVAALTDEPECKHGDWITVDAAKGLHECVKCKFQTMLPCLLHGRVECATCLETIRRATAPVPAEPVAWLVGNDPDTAATYNRSQREQAFDAARRWGCSITALTTAAGAPEFSKP